MSRSNINWQKAVSIKWDFEKECFVPKNAIEIYEVLTAAFDLPDARDQQEIKNGKKISLDSGNR